MLIAALDPWSIWGNYAEAGLWAALALVAVAAAVRRTDVARRRAVIGAILLLAFGGSDVIETQTGAWWRPWWLLTWKAICVAGLVVVTLAELRTAQRNRRT